MTERDDMVISPRLEPGNAAAENMREARALRESMRRGGSFHQLLRARRLMQIARARRAQAAARAAKVARAGTRTAAQAGGRLAARAGARVFSNPVGLIVAVILVAAAVTVKLATGRTFENMGEELKKSIFGDDIEKGMAMANVRKRFQADSEISRIVGQEGQVNSQILTLARDLQKIEEREVIGASIIKRDPAFQVKGTLDVLIERARDVIVEAFTGSGGPSHVERLRTKMATRNYGGRC